MNTSQSMKDELSDAASRAEVARWIPLLFRAGYAAKGVVYAIVGFLAAELAFSDGGQTTGSRGALQEIAEEPWGTAALTLVGIGLVGYALWKFVQAIKDPERKGSDAKGMVKRTGLFGSGLIHSSLAYSAFANAFGGGGSGGGSSTQGLTAKFMTSEWGLWLVGLAGVVTMLIGVYQFYMAFKSDLAKRWHTEEMSAAEVTWGQRAGMFGLSARGVVFGLMGWFFIQAALEHDSSEAGGLETVLDSLAASGPWVLGIVALGLMAYAVFCFVKARYRHFQVR